MADRGTLDEALIARLPLPVAQLYRRAHNAKSPLERHLSAFYFWEAGLKLLSASAVVDYAGLGATDATLADELKDLARPALGHWWKFARRLVPILADANVAGWPAARDLLLGRSRDDLPRAAGLDAVLIEVLHDKHAGRATVRLTELFDRLVQYRNAVLGHAAPGHRTDEFHERQARALLAGIAEIWATLDVLAGRQLIYVPEVRAARGSWLVQRYELRGEAPRRFETLELPRDVAAPDQQAIYLAPGDLPGAKCLTSLHPLVLFDLDATQVWFLNARRGQARVEYLCYTTGQTTERDDLGAERRELLARALKMAVTLGDEAAWSDHTYREEPFSPGDSPGTKSRSLGEFELLSELGRGGMGVVYRAWQPSLGRQVALKKLLPSADLARAEERFRREIKALGRVDHPHLVKVFTSGSDGDEWYFAMELVEGAPLSDVCSTLHANSPDASTVDLRAWHQCVSSACAKVRAEEKPLSAPGLPVRADDRQSGAESPDTHRPRETINSGRTYVAQIVTLLHQVASAAHALHEHGIVHRDIKPGNIQLSRDGANATLMDLGLAQIADEVDGRLTRTRQFVGTLRYASPEQVLSVGKLDRRSDVYSLGATLWELLTLRPLFGATDQTPTPQLMLDIQNREPDRLRKLNLAVSRDLEAIVHKALEKRPEHRYATARDMTDDLQRVLDGEPVTARAVGGFDRAWKWVKRRPVLALLAAVSILWALATVGVIVSQIGRSRLASALGEAERQRQRADDNRQLAERKQIEADQQRDLVRRYLYASRIHLAHEARRDAQISRMGALMDELERDFSGPESDALRGFEWNYLRQLRNQCILTIKAHSAEVRCIKYSPDGRRLLSMRGYAHVWDVATGARVLTLENPISVSAGCFTPDGAEIVTCSHDQKVRIWNATSGQLVKTLDGPTRAMRGVALDSSGRRLAAVGMRDDGNGDIRVWDRSTGNVLMKTTANMGGWVAFALNPGGSSVATADRNGDIQIWDVTSGQKRTLQRHTGGIARLAYSPDGNQLASAGLDGTARVWDSATGNSILVCHGHKSAVFSVAYSADAKHLVTASADGTVRTWNSRTGAAQLIFRGHEGNVFVAEFSPDGRRIASSGYDTTVKFWDATQPQEYRVLRGHSGGVDAVAIAPDGQTAASAGRDAKIRLWNLQDDREKQVLKGHKEGVRCLDWSPDGARLASGSWDLTIRIWDAKTGKELRSLSGHAGDITRVVFSPDGRRLASSSGDKTVKIWDVETGRLLVTCQGHTNWAQGVAFTPDGKHVVSAGSDETVRIWDAETGREVRVLRGHRSQVVCVAVHPSGRFLASGGTDTIVHIWDFATGRERYALRGAGRDIQCVAFTPDGRRLASADYDGVIKLWDTTMIAPDNPEDEWSLLTGQEVLSLTSPSSNRTVAFGRNGAILASCGLGSSAVRIWNAMPSDSKTAVNGRLVTIP